MTMGTSWSRSRTDLRSSTPAHPRHLQVAHDGVEGGFGDEGKRLRAVRRAIEAVVRIAQNSAIEARDGVVILHDENPLEGRSTRRRRAHPWLCHHVHRLLRHPIVHVV